MAEFLYTLADLLLALGATLRLTRLVVTDDLGKWWLREPLDDWFHARPGSTRRMRFHHYLSGLECPHCVGFHAAWVTVLALMIAGGPGEAAAWWRIGAGILTLSWVAAHIGVRFGDAGYADDLVEDDTAAGDDGF